MYYVMMEKTIIVYNFPFAQIASIARISLQVSTGLFTDVMSRYIMRNYMKPLTYTETLLTHIEIPEHII